MFLTAEWTFRATFLGCAELDRVDVKVRLSAVERWLNCYTEPWFRIQTSVWCREMKSQPQHNWSFCLRPVAAAPSKPALMGTDCFQQYSYIHFGGVTFNKKKKKAKMTSWDMSLLRNTDDWPGYKWSQLFRTTEAYPCSEPAAWQPATFAPKYPLIFPANLINQEKN